MFCFRYLVFFGLISFGILLGVQAHAMGGARGTAKVALKYRGANSFEGVMAEISGEKVTHDLVGEFKNDDQADMQCVARIEVRYEARERSGVIRGDDVQKFQLVSKVMLPGEMSRVHKEILLPDSIAHELAYGPPKGAEVERLECFYIDQSAATKTPRVQVPSRP